MMTQATADLTTETTVNFSELVGRVTALKGNPAWLAEQRRAAFDTYQAAPLPARVAHLWRYTDPAAFVPRLDPDTWPGAGTVDKTVPAMLDTGLNEGDLSGIAYSNNGQVVKTQLLKELLDRGVRIVDLNDAANDVGDIVKNRLGTLVGADFGKFEALVSALWTAGLLVYVPKGVIIDKPVHVMTTITADIGFTARRLLVVVEDGASLTLIDEYGEAGARSMVTAGAAATVELFVGRNAEIKYVPIQNWGPNITSFLTQRAQVDADGRVNTVLTALGSKISKVDCGTELAGKGAESNIYGLAIGTGRQHFDHHTVHRHKAGSTQSDLKFKVALRDKANSVYTGLIGIEPKAEFCEAYQENRNLLLSPGANAETIPELEIANNEVKCSHGATVGKVDPEEIFYLGARGIDPREAVRLIVSGFVGPIIDQMPAGTRERIHEVALDRLGEAVDDNG
ncbi:MAG: Fe-S cluster assembly protein SufD [Candidatus Zixiibacteriota bacterium]